MRRRSCFLLGLADVRQLALDGRLVKHFERQIHEQADAVHHVPEGLFEGPALLGVSAFDGGRVFKSPMRRDRLTRPHRTHFAGGVVADGDDEVHLRCVGRGVLVPALAAQILGRVIHRLHLFDGEGIDLAGWVTAGAVGAEALLPHRVDESFGHDAARRIAGAEDEDVIDSFGHDVSLSGSGWGAMAMDERSVASSMTWPAAFRSE